ncbi:MAG: hypothetical protein ACE15B_00920 [Bryobacteraceae bacterium]
MLGVLLWLAAAQTPDPETLLPRIRAHMAANLAGLPNYTCGQNIERSVKPASGSRYQTRDTVRIEVAFVDGRELFAWPGAPKFEERPLDQMIGGGAIGTGAFAMHAEAVFRGNAAVFTYGGAAPENGRTVVRFDYRIPVHKSQFFVRSGPNQATVPYHGSFWADAATLDVLRLAVEANDIPGKVGVRSTGLMVEYGRRRIGGSEYLLPVTAELTIADSAGNESRNRTRFESCRQYTGASVISFGEPAPAAAPPAPAAKPVTVPRGTLLELSLQQPLELSQAVIGDAVSAAAMRDVKYGGTVLIPRGAQFTLRITRLRRHEGGGRAGPYYVLGVQMESVESGGGRSRIRAHLEEVTFANRRYYVPFARQPAVAPAPPREPVAPPSPGEGVVLAPGNSRLPARLRMLWAAEE